MNVYQYRDIVERVTEAEEMFSGNGPTVALLEAVLEQNEMIGDMAERMKSLKRELDYIKLCIEDIDEK